MKKLTFLLISLFAYLTVFAGEVTEQQALQIAQKFMQGKQFKQQNLRRAPSKNVENKAYYVFNVENNGGFVIVSGDDRMTDILGYSNKGSLNVDSIPDGLKWLLGYYEEIAQYISESGETTVRKNRAERLAVSPLMVTEWGQNYPYNLQCPNVGSSQCITGCVATALAQIMNYCQWPEGPTTSIASYKTFANGIDMPTLEPAIFNWDYMNESELSKLMRYCGQAIKMDYGLNSSGAFTILAADALVNDFGYANTVTAVDHVNYTDDGWEELMYEEIAAKRAILFGGTNSSGNEGHAFVIHGYDSGKFYINWGWDGIDDGYFALTGLMPDGSNFNYNQHAIIGIQPSSGIKTQPKHPVATTVVISYGDAISYDLREDNDAFPEYGIQVEVESSVISQPIQIGCGLYNEAGLQKVLFSDQHTFAKDEQYYCSGSVTLDSSTPDGEYYIYPICRSNDSEEWLKNVRSDVNCLKVSIHDDLRKIQAIRNWRNVIDADKRLLNFVGVSRIDGIQYDLYEERGNKRAIVIPIKGGYAGDIDIPAKVNYRGEDYSVYEAAGSSFSNCSELTSLETSMTYGPHVSSCPQLRQLIFKEGMKTFDESVDNCPLLEYIEFPQSAEMVKPYFVAMEKLTTIRFKSPERLVIKSLFFDFGSNCSITDIYFHQTTPPEIPDGWQPVDINEWADIITLHIPHGNKSLYEASIWKSFKLVDDISVDYQSNKIYWGYCQSVQTPNGKSLEQFDQRGLDREFAIRVPSEYLTAYKNCKITAIQFYTGELDMDMADYVFVTKSGTDYLSKEIVNADRRTWATTKLSSPVTIDGDELYVGIGRRDNLRVYYSADNFEVGKDALWMRNMNPNGMLVDESMPIGEWKSSDLTDPVCIRFVIEGEDLPYDILLNKIRIDKNKLYATVTSRTPDYINSFALNWELNSNQKGIQEISSGLIPNGLGEYIIDLPADLKGFNHDIRFEVADINGKPDAVPENDNYTYYFELQPITTYPRTAVMESLTGTWCGFSPRGTVGMQLLKQDFGDRFIPIAIHYANEYTSDIMHLPEYETPINESTSVPICYINRGKWIDPLLGEAIMPPYGIKDDVEKVLNHKSPVALGIETKWNDSEKTSIEITTSTVFGGDDDQIPYQLAYVLLEDGLHGDGEDWYQNNGISNDTGLAYGNQTLMEYVSLPGQLTDVKYDHVPVAAWGTMEGIEGTVPKSVKEGEIYGYTFNADITDNTHIQNKDNLSVVVLLLNKKTGAVVTATSCKLGESSAIPAPNPIPGDVTGSGTVDVQDATLVVNYIIGNGSDEYDYTIADMNGDNEIDVFDVTAMINVILGNSNNAPTLRRSMEPNESVILSADGNEVLVAVDNASRFTSFQFDVKVPKGAELLGVDWNGKTDSHLLQFAKTGEDTYKVVALSMESTPFSELNGALLKLHLSNKTVGEMTIDNILFVTPMGEAVRFGSHPLDMTTGIQSVTHSQAGQIYDLSGQRLNMKREQLPKGVYIINNQKVVIK